MQAGTLRHRITIQSPPPASGDPFASLPSGSPPAWIPVVTMWASISPLTSKEVFQAGQLNMKVSHKIMIRYPGAAYTVSAGDQVVFGFRVFNLATGIINPDERNIVLELLAYEITANQ